MSEFTQIFPTLDNGYSGASDDGEAGHYGRIGLYLKCGKLLRELLAVYKINSVGDFDLMI